MSNVVARCLCVVLLVAVAPGCADREPEAVTDNSGSSKATANLSKHHLTSESISIAGPGLDEADSTWPGFNRIVPSHGRPKVAAEFSTDASTLDSSLDKFSRLNQKDDHSEDFIQDGDETTEEGSEYQHSSAFASIEAVYEELRQRLPISKEMALDAIDDADPYVRAEGAWNLPPEGGNLDRLIELVAEDPDPVVRMAALASLEESETYAAIKGMVDALGDPDPDVVLAAIDSLEFVGDETHVRDLERLLMHPEPRVVEATEGAIKYLGRIVSY